MRYGFVGLGNLGSKLASSLLKSGFQVTLFDKDQSVSESFKLKGADVCDTVKQLSQCVDYVITCLPSPKVSSEVISKALPHMADGFSMDLALKDLGFADQFSKEFGVPLNLLNKVKQIFEEGHQRYVGQAQSTQIVKLLEGALGTDSRADGYPSLLE